MPFLRRHMRITDTQDLSVRLRCRGRGYRARRVLNLSEGGMLIAGGELEVGEIAEFELAGGELRSAGAAEVAHRTGKCTGLRFLGLNPSGRRDIRQIIRIRRPSQHPERTTDYIPGLYLG